MRNQFLLMVLVLAAVVAGATRTVGVSNSS